MKLLDTHYAQRLEDTSPRLVFRHVLLIRKVNQLPHDITVLCMVMLSLVVRRKDVICIICSIGKYQVNHLTNGKMKLT